MSMDNEKQCELEEKLRIEEKLKDEKIRMEKLKVENKRNYFDREFRLLVKQAQETISERYGLSLELGSSRPELICLNRYISIYNHMTPEEHYEYFETLYNRKRVDILNSLSDTKWIKNGNVVIQFGAGIKSTKEKEEKLKLVRIMLSDIFKIAYDLQDKAEKKLDGIDENFTQDIDSRDLIRPNILLLHLMRIFYHLNDSSDKVELGKIVSQLEDELGVKNKTVDIQKSIFATPNSGGPQTSSGLSGLFTMATSMMERMGMKPPPEMKPPSDADINNIINTVIGNETTQSTIEGMLQSLKGCNDIGSAIQSVIKNVSDPKTMESIKSSIAQTAQMASEGETGIVNSFKQQPQSFDE